MPNPEYPTLRDKVLLILEKARENSITLTTLDVVWYLGNNRIFGPVVVPQGKVYLLLQKMRDEKIVVGDGTGWSLPSLAETQEE